MQILKGVWNVPWSVTWMDNSIRTIMSVISVRVIHFLWESNTFVDYFTNLIVDYAGEF